MVLIKLFLGLLAGTMLGIIAHEAAHHLFGLPSSFSLSRNWPEAKVTEANRLLAARGALAGPLPLLIQLWHRAGIGPYLGSLLCLAAFFTGGFMLMGLDRLFKPRFRIIHRGGRSHV